MGDGKKGIIQALSEGGIIGEHPPVGPFEFVVGPTTTDQFNTAHLPLIPIGCFRVDDVRFAFDSSFVNADPDPDNRNDIRTELAHLVDLVKAHPGAPLSVFGHADPVGNDDYNKLLSGRRAMAIYAVLIANGDRDRAVKLWDFVSRVEHWGAKQRDTMQTFTGLPSGTPDSVLFQSYLQKLCPPELILRKQDFLAQGADSGGKGDFQGCSEFNPVLLFSKEKQSEFDRAQQQNDKAGIEKRNAANARNRRVLVLMFRKGSRIDPAKWPCPRATEGVAGCIKRFWSDGEKRRSTHLPNDVDQTFEDKKSTFACRFYQRLSDNSPCEKIIELVPLIIRLVDELVIEQKDQPFNIDNLTYRLEVGDLKLKGVVAQGMIQHLIPKDAISGRLILLRESQGAEPLVLWTLTLGITDKLVDSSEVAGAQVRLNNLGFFAGDQITGQLDDQTKRALQRFQTLYKLKDDQGKDESLTGALTKKTADELKERYGS